MKKWLFVVVLVVIVGCDKNNNKIDIGVTAGDSSFIMNSKISDYTNFNRQMWYVFKTAISPVSSSDHFQIIDSFCNNDSLEMFKYSPEVSDTTLFKRIRGYGIPNSVMDTNNFNYEKYFANICSGEKTSREKKFKQIVIRYEKFSADSIIRYKKFSEDSVNNLNKLRRKIFCDSIRNYYLDMGMDIKVKVYGKNGEYIKFTYILFNDVWTHKFSKAGNVEFLMNIGFKKITFTDGYDYYVYWENK